AARLKRGQLAIDGRIDLHGMTQAKAHRALEGFLTASQGAGKRCVLVITGKGLRPTGETGVLRNLVPRWMNAPAIRGRVLSFCTAQPRDGGTGALYVLLKRKR
ncbi:MAG: Smr/MutS family protein, partial [Alphaproteobacteria bacterium]